MQSLGSSPGPRSLDLTSNVESRGFQQKAFLDGDVVGLELRPTTKETHPFPWSWGNQELEHRKARSRWGSASSSPSRGKFSGMLRAERKVDSTRGDCKSTRPSSSNSNPFQLLASALPAQPLHSLRPLSDRFGPSPTRNLPKPAGLRPPGGQNQTSPLDSRKVAAQTPGKTGGSELIPPGRAHYPVKASSRR